MKKKTYKIVSNLGIKLLSKLFPGEFQTEPLVSDRYIEYWFAAQALPKSGKVLDVGCSGSYFPLILSGFGYEVFGRDIRPYPILRHIIFPLFKFFQGEASERLFGDNFFDAITCISTLEHMGVKGRYGITREQVKAIEAVKEFRRILKQGGILIITVPFGKYKLLRPHHEIYDNYLTMAIKEVGGMDIVDERYYRPDEHGDWVECSMGEAFETPGTKDRSALCCLKMVKR